MTIQQQSKLMPGRGHRLGDQVSNLRFAEPMVRGYFQVRPTSAKHFNSIVLGSDCGSDWKRKRVAT